MSNPKTPSRREFLAKTTAASLASAFPAGAAQTPAIQSRRRPLNVLFFMSDDMRPELGSYGSRFHVQSPNVDKLGSAGVRFDRNFCQFPLCNPSRSSLFTGHPPHTTKVLGNSTSVRNLHPDWVTLPQLFREHGYTTLRSGKLFHAGLDDHKAWTDFDGDTESLHPTQAGKRMDIPRARIPMPNGVLPVLPADNQRAAHSDQILVLDGNGEGSGDYLVADRAIQNLRACKDQPFFIGCGFSKPHSPPTAPERFFDLYDVNKIQLPPDFAAWPTVPPGFPQAAIRMRNADLFIGRGASESEAKQVIRAYLASISWADWNLGRVLAELDSLDLRDKRSSSSSPITATSSAKKANGRKPARSLKTAPASRSSSTLPQPRATAARLPASFSPSTSTVHSSSSAVSTSPPASKATAWRRFSKTPATPGTTPPTASGAKTERPSTAPPSAPSNGATPSLARTRRTEPCSSTATPIPWN